MPNLHASIFDRVSLWHLEAEEATKTKAANKSLEEHEDAVNHVDEVGGDGSVACERSLKSDDEGVEGSDETGNGSLDGADLALDQLLDGGGEIGLKGDDEVLDGRDCDGDGLEGVDDGRHVVLCQAGQVSNRAAQERRGGSHDDGGRVLYRVGDGLDIVLDLGLDDDGDFGADVVADAGDDGICMVRLACDLGLDLILLIWSRDVWTVALSWLAASVMVPTRVVWLCRSTMAGAAKAAVAKRRTLENFMFAVEGEISRVG